LTSLVNEIKSGGKVNIIHKGALDMIKGFSKQSKAGGVADLLHAVQKYVVKP
jgi:hypothetical protein